MDRLKELEDTNKSEELLNLKLNDENQVLND
jgi:hypothetical protein